MYSFRLAINIEEREGRKITVMSLCIFIINFNVSTHVTPRRGFLFPLLDATVKCLSLPNSREIAAIRQHATLLPPPPAPPRPTSLLGGHGLLLPGSPPAGEMAPADAKPDRRSGPVLLVKSGRWRVCWSLLSFLGVFRVSLTFHRHSRAHVHPNTSEAKQM